MKYKGIVFDKDGTLIDFNSTWLPVYEAASQQLAQANPSLASALLTQHGYDESNKTIRGGSLLAAGNNKQIADAWFQQLRHISGIQQTDISRCLDHIFAKQGRMSAVAVPDLKITLEGLKQQDLKLGIATADSYQGILNTLEAFDVIRLFDFLCGYDSGHGMKPEAGMVLAFCRAQSLRPTEVVVVGDNYHDIEMGRNAKAGLCVGVLTGTSTRAQLEQVADVVLDDIRALPAVLMH